MTVLGDNRRGVWAGKIREAWRESVNAVCAVGRLLSEAKDDLPHGQFEKMAETELAFGPRTARRLMAVGADPRIRTHGSVLPISWRTLYELTRLTDEQFQAGLDSGIINAGMYRSDVASLCPKSVIDVNEARLVAAGNRLIDGIRDFLDGADCMTDVAGLSTTVDRLSALIQAYELAKEKFLSFDGVDPTSIDDMNALAAVANGKAATGALKALVAASYAAGSLVGPCNELIALCDRRIAELQSETGAGP